MKMAWNIVAVIAVANLIALGGFVGWLRASDRLNVDRARAVRAMMSKTISKEKQEADEAKAKEAAEAKSAEAARRAGQPPLTAQERVALRLEATELDRQRAERLRREISDMQNALANERSALDKDKAEFEARRKAFDEVTASTQRERTDEQFRKTLGVLSSLKPKDAASLLKQLLTPAPTTGATPATGTVPDGLAANTPSTPSTSGPAPTEAGGGMAQVVSYLDAMDEKPRGKIIAEFAKSDPGLATELLERLRQRSQFAAVPRTTP